MRNFERETVRRTVPPVTTEADAWTPSEGAALTLASFFGPVLIRTPVSLPTPGLFWRLGLIRQDLADNDLSRPLNTFSCHSTSLHHSDLPKPCSPVAGPSSDGGIWYGQVGPLRSCEQRLRRGMALHSCRHDSPGWMSGSPERLTKIRFPRSRQAWKTTRELVVPSAPTPSGIGSHVSAGRLAAWRIYRLATHWPWHKRTRRFGYFSMASTGCCVPDEGCVHCTLMCQWLTAAENVGSPCWLPGWVR